MMWYFRGNYGLNFDFLIFKYPLDRSTIIHCQRYSPGGGTIEKFNIYTSISGFQCRLVYLGGSPKNTAKYYTPVNYSSVKYT